MSALGFVDELGLVSVADGFAAAPAVPAVCDSEVAVPVLALVCGGWLDEEAGGVEVPVPVLPVPALQVSETCCTLETEKLADD